MRTIPQLSPRHHDVLICLANGMTAKEIGKELSISHRTVEAHLVNIRKFFGLPRSSRELTAWAVRHERELRSENGYGCSHDSLLTAACRDFQMRLQTITGDPHWRHPNLATAADRLRKIEEDLLAWSRNQRLAAAEVVETIEEEAVDEA